METPPLDDDVALEGEVEGGAGGIVGDVVAFISNGLSHLALGNVATRAIGKLLGFGAHYVGSGLKRQSRTDDARSGAHDAITKAVGAAAAKRAAKDPLLTEMMIDRWASSEFGKFENVAAVAVKAVECLAEPSDKPALADDSEGPSDDFMNLFGSCAEKASSENLRSLFGRILAGEIREPGTFSLRTLMLVSVLDQRSAEAIQQARAWLKENVIFAKYPDEALKPPIDILIELGIVRSESITWTIHSASSQTAVCIPFLTKALVAFGNVPGLMGIDVPAFRVTSMGQEIFSLLPPCEDIAHIREIGQHVAAFGMNNQIHIQRVEMGDVLRSEGGTTVVQNSEVLWSK